MLVRGRRASRPGPPGAGRPHARPAAALTRGFRPRTDGGGHPHRTTTRSFQCPTPIPPRLASGRSSGLADATARAVAEHLDRHVAPHLAPDVSNYARGRQRAWLEIEAPLGPTQPWRPGPRLGAALALAGPGLAGDSHPASEPALGLAIRGDVGIAWHRDAAYAKSDAIIVNLGPATFEIDAERDSANGRPLDPVSLDLRPGDVIAFDCKHQHRVLDADPARWSVVLWRLKRFPPAPVEPVGIP